MNHKTRILLLIVLSLFAGFLASKIAIHVDNFFYFSNISKRVDIETPIIEEIIKLSCAILVVAFLKPKSLKEFLVIGFLTGIGFTIPEEQIYKDIYKFIVLKDRALYFLGHGLYTSLTCISFYPLWNKRNKKNNVILFIGLFSAIFFHSMHNGLFTRYIQIPNERIYDIVLIILGLINGLVLGGMYYYIASATKQKNLKEYKDEAKALFLAFLSGIIFLIGNLTWVWTLLILKIDYNEKAILPFVLIILIYMFFGIYFIYYFLHRKFIGKDRKTLLYKVLGALSTLYGFFFLFVYSLWTNLQPDEMNKFYLIFAIPHLLLSSIMYLKAMKRVNKKSLLIGSLTIIFFVFGIYHFYGDYVLNPTEICLENPLEYSNCIMKVAEKTGMAEICQQLQNPLDKDICEIKSWLTIDKVPHCDRLSTKEGQELCEIFWKNNIKRCNDIEGIELRDYCIYKIATHIKNYSWCKKISEEYMKNECTSKEASWKNNLTVCYKIENLSMRDVCIFNNYENCSQNQNKTYESYCLLADVFYEQDEKLCEKVKMPYLKLTCKLSFKDYPEGCLGLEDESKRLDCMRIVAFINYKPDECKILQETKQVDECYNRYAETTQDSSICLKITDKKTKDKCYINTLKTVAENI